MKKLIAMVAGALLLNLSALAQGTILLQNFGAGFASAGIKDLSGTLIPAGSSQYTIEFASPLFGMPSGYTFVFIPEPSTIVLAVLGAAALFLRRRN